MCESRDRQTDRHTHCTWLSTPIVGGVINRTLSGHNQLSFNWESLPTYLFIHRRAWVQIAAATLSGNSLRQTVHTGRASVHQAAKLVAKLVAALYRVARVTAGLAESNSSLSPGFSLTSPAGWLPRTGISSETLCLAVEYGLPLPFSTVCRYTGGEPGVHRGGATSSRPSSGRPTSGVALFHPGTRHARL